MRGAFDTAQNWLITGLGNPGPEYENTRHNLGFMVIDRLAERWGILVRREECRSLIGQVKRGDSRIELAKPLTYMNLSGEAVSCLLKDESRSINSMLVVSDDLAIPFGSLRLRGKGSDGGHNGLKSLTQCLKTEKYARLRIGIQPEHPLSNAKRFVLERFPSKAHSDLNEILETASDAVESFLTDGIDRAMSRFNS